MDNLGSSIKKLAAIALVGFLLVGLMLTYWQVIAAPALNQAIGNNRAERMRRLVHPGQLLTQDQTVILDAEKGENGWEQIYSGGEAFAHLTGYNGQSGLQKPLANVLYARERYAHPYEDLMRGELRGNDVYLTIDGRAQQLAYRLMVGKRGAVIAMDVRDGALLVLYSAPTYSPADVLKTSDAYNLFVLDPERPEINRPLQGMYAPGSVFKIFTAAAGIDAGITDPGDEFHCAGQERVAGTLVKCHRPAGHGSLSLRWAMADSCNIAFAKLGDRLGPERARKYVKRFHLLDAADVYLPVATGRMADFTGYKGEMQLVEASFGQGATLITPLCIARLTATIARGGEVIQPYLVDHVQTPGGRVLVRGEGKVLCRAVSVETAQAVAGMMRTVVERGTGHVADIGDVQVAAKTGSAQNSSGAPHSWFTCFAPFDSPEVVVTVIVENGGAGSAVAGPIAVEILQALLGVDS